MIRDSSSQNAGVILLPRDKTLHLPHPQQGDGLHATDEVGLGFQLAVQVQPYRATCEAETDEKVLPQSKYGLIKQNCAHNFPACI